MSFDFAYPLAPLAGYVAAGCVKFAVNSARARRLAFDRIGMGGWPSTHNTIVSAPIALAALREGLDAPLVSVGLGLALVVAIDSMDLRRKIGKQAEALQRLSADDPQTRTLRTRIGHTPAQVAAGWLTGIAVAIILNLLFPSEALVSTEE